MMLLPDWRHIARRAWSVRLSLAAAAVELAGVALSVHGMFVEREAWALAFQLGGAALAIGASIARLMHQRDMP